jgi:VanZ family protein
MFVWDITKKGRIAIRPYSSVSGYPIQTYECVLNKVTSRAEFRFWGPVLIWMVFIFWMSTGTFSAQNTSLIIEPIIRFFVPSISQEKMEVIHIIIRKLGHLSEYFILGILLFRFFRSGSEEPLELRWAFFSFLVLLVYAASDEFHQSFVSGRTASPMDVGIDALGGVVAQAVSILRRLGLRQ